MTKLSATLRLEREREKERERERVKAFLFHARDFPSDIVEAGWPSG